jgi:hypothetical protein
LTQQLINSPRKQLLDEASFQQLLAAAYVLQQHTESFHSPEILSEFIRMQRLIRSGRYGLVENAKLIADQVQRFTGASGVAIGIATNDEVIYLAANGTAAREIGLRVPSDSSLSSYCLRTGLTLQSLRTEDEPRMLFAVCNRAGVRSFIGVPVTYENSVVGVLEARFKVPNAFREEDVQTCELMAVLVKEIIAQAGQPQIASARPPGVRENFDEPYVADLVEAQDVPRTDQQLELPPQAMSPVNAVQTLSEAQVVAPAEVHEIPGMVTIEPAAPRSGELVSPDTVSCRGCGQILASEESFCGNCGTERISNPDGPLQSKWASLWYMNQARKSAEPDNDVAAQASNEDTEHTAEHVASDAELSEAYLPEPERSAPTYDLVHSAAATLAAPVRLEWLPEAASSESWLRHQWRVNRANFYLGGAALLLVIVLSGWGTSPVQNLGSTANSSGPQLTLFERMLVALGIAEAPATPVYLGNPDTPVWVDLHTALYYCPGADLYGKTEGGKIATQRSAQMDQFEPAHRKACN